MSNIKQGSYVFINKNIKTTHKYYNSCREMHRMAGNGELFKVDNVFRSMKTGKPALKIKTYTWDIDDVTLPSDLKANKDKPLKFKFKVEQLDI